MNNTIKIFLASSAELKDDRLAIENFIGRENKLLQKEDTFLHLDIWEDFIDSVSQTRLQDEYNKKIQEADIFIMLFFTKVGMYTSEEFDKALQQFKQTNKPLIYTYFKNAHIKFNDLNRKDANSIWDFLDKLKNLGHFQTVYENEAELTLHFSSQLDKLFSEDSLIKGKKSVPVQQIPKCLSAGQPSVTPDFLGREIELADIKSKLEKNGLLLINAEGGMGKTTIAAKYLNDNIDRYKHFAWFFCESGIFEEIKTLAPKFGIDLTKYAHEADQLLAIKTEMENLGKDCLLILDNANDPARIEAFQKNFDGLHWHVLLTSRCQQVLPGNEYTLNHLKPEEAKALFKTYHDEKTDQFEKLLDKFLTGIGYNTLMIELFSKNLHELSALSETLESALKQFEEKGLFLGERSFEIKTAYTKNVHKEAATTDHVIEVLYDLTQLTEEERHLLVNFALLPAESQLVTLLIEVFTPEDKIAFTKQLKSLAKKGWLNTDTISYRMSPVVQQIVLEKNKHTLLEDSANLISNLSYRLKHTGPTLINTKNHATAKPFAEIAKSATWLLKNKTFEIGILHIHLCDYYKVVGNFKASIIQINKAEEIFEKNDKENHLVCLERFGDIYQLQGDFKKALSIFELRSRLAEELFNANPQKESLKNGLAISYERLGSIYQKQGDFKKAIRFFKRYNNLNKELVEANPQNESFKNGLAIFYERIGSIHQQQGDFKKAIQFFEKYNNLTKELFEANPNNELLKNELAISYERLGTVYRQQGDFKKAVHLFELRIQLANELFEANPNSVDLYNGLAVSCTALGHIYLKINEPVKTKEYYKQAETIWLQLTKSVPESPEFKNNLDWVQKELENLSNNLSQTIA